MKNVINIVLIFIIMFLILLMVCSDRRKEDPLIIKLEKDKKNGNIKDIDLKTLEYFTKNNKIGLIELNEDRKEYYSPTNLYSGYYNWKPYGYHHNFYPYRRYLRPYYSYSYPGSWYRHYGNYYYAW